MGISKMNVQAPGCLTSTSSGPIPTSVMCLIVVYSFTLLNIMEFQNGEVSSFLFAYFLDDLCLFYSSVLNFCKKKLCDLFFFNWVFITLTSFRWNIFLIGFTCWEKTAGKLASISSAVQQSVRSHHFLPSCVVLLSRRDWVHKLLYFLLCCFYIQNILSFNVNLWSVWVLLVNVTDYPAFKPLYIWSLGHSAIPINWSHEIQREMI